MTATSLTRWSRVIHRALSDAGYDADAMFQQVGLDLDALHDPLARYPLSKTTALWRLAVEQTGDAAFGLKVASSVGASTFQILHGAVGASATLQDAFERIVRYFRLVTDAAELSFQVGPDECWLRLEVPAHRPPPAPEAIDAFMSIFVRVARSLSGSELRPKRIFLVRPEPADRTDFDAILRAPIVFDAGFNALVLDRADCMKLLEGANPELALEAELIARKYLARLGGIGMASQIEHALVVQLPKGEYSREQIARHLNIPARTLQRRLQEEGSSYSEILDATRRNLALEYLTRTGHSVIEVAHLLGFSDSSNFTRACRRWTGRSPSQLRQQNADGDAAPTQPARRSAPRKAEPASRRR